METPKQSSNERYAPNVPMGPERALGTVKAQVIYLPDIGLYSITMVDKFGIAGARTGRTEPTEAEIEQAMEIHARISQSATRRN